MNISNATKDLLKDLSQQINNGEFEELFVEADLRGFTSSQMMELHHILLNANIIDSTNIRNKLLFEDAKMSLKSAEMHQDDPAMKDKYLVQFIRAHLGGRYGFELSEVIQFMIDNQKLLGIKLTPAHKVSPGQNGIRNYKIEFVN